MRKSQYKPVFPDPPIEYHGKHNLLKRRFWRLRVRAYYGKGRNKYDDLWLVECECGTFTVVSYRHLLRGHTKSCGCLREDVLSGPQPHRRKADAPLIALISAYRQRASRKGIEFTLTQEQARTLFTSNCRYCGRKPSQRRRRANAVDDKSDFIYNGIDRLDSRVGYTPKNCVSACAQCNYAKGTLSVRKFRAWIERVHNHL